MFQKSQSASGATTNPTNRKKKCKQLFPASISIIPFNFTFASGGLLGNVFLHILPHLLLSRDHDDHHNDRFTYDKKDHHHDHHATEAFNDHHNKEDAYYHRDKEDLNDHNNHNDHHDGREQHENSIKLRRA